MPSDRPLTVTDLVGEAVDLHLVSPGYGGKLTLRNVCVTHVTKTWLGIAFSYRGIFHRTNLPIAAIIAVDHRSRRRDPFTP